MAFVKIKPKLRAGRGRAKPFRWERILQMAKTSTQIVSRSGSLAAVLEQAGMED